MTLEQLVILIQGGRAELMPELWERVYLFIRQQARSRLLHLPPHMRDLEDDLSNAGYFALANAAKCYQAGKGASFIHFLTFHLKTAFNDAMNVRTVAGQNAPDRYAVSLDAPVSGDTGDIMLADTLTDPEAEEAYNRVLEKSWRRDLRGILERAIKHATEDKPEARRVWLFMLEHNTSLPEAARRLDMEYGAARTARDTTRYALMRYINRYERDI